MEVNVFVNLHPIMNRLLLYIFFFTCGIKGWAQSDSVYFNNNFVEGFTKSELPKVADLFILPPNNKILVTFDSIYLNYLDENLNSLWKKNIYSKISASPVNDDNFFVIGTADGDIILIDEKTGMQDQSFGTGDSISSGIELFDYEGRKELVFPKMSDSKSAFLIGNRSGKIVCYDLETLQEYWRSNFSGSPIKSPMKLYNNKLFFTNSEGYLNCVDLHNGLLIWRWKETETSSFDGSEILINKKDVFVVGENGTIYAIDISLGRLSWKTSNIKFQNKISFTFDSKFVLAQVTNGRIYWIDPATGKYFTSIKSNYELNDPTSSILSTKNFLLYTNKTKMILVDSKKKEFEIFSSEAEIIKFGLMHESKIYLIDADGNLFFINLREL